MILGFCGLAGSGKSTAADAVVRSGSFVEVALADAIKRICLDVFDFSEEQLWGPSSFRDDPDERNLLTGKGEFLTPRFALQTLGTEWGRTCHPDVWIEQVLRVYVSLQRGGCYYSRLSGLRHTSSFDTVGNVPSLQQAKTNIVISDVRFRNEVEAILRAGGSVYRLLRGEGLEGSAGGHASEQGVHDIPLALFSGVLDNRAWSLHDLKTRVRALPELQQIIEPTP